MCVIVATHDSRIIDDPTLVDKEAILCSLNIKTMSFRGIADLWKSTPNKALRTLELLRKCNYLTVLTCSARPIVTASVMIWLV